jgi:hypothetical protein
LIYSYINTSGNWVNEKLCWKTIKKFQALAFVPSDRVIDAFEELVTSSNPETDELLRDFLVYFETPWIGVVQRGRRHRSLFDIDLWNVHDRVEILPRMK